MQKEALAHILETVLGMGPKDTQPIWLSLLHHHSYKEDQLSIYDSWIFLSDDKIDVLKFRTDSNKTELYCELGNGHKAHFDRFKAMFIEKNMTPGWDHMEIFNITNEEYVQFSFRRIRGLVAALPAPEQSLRQAHSKYADYLALLEKTLKRDSPFESTGGVEPKEGVDKSAGEDAATAKAIKEVPSILSSLLAIPTIVLPSKADANDALYIIGDVAKGNLEFVENLSHFNPKRASSPFSKMFAVDPQLPSFHRGHQAFSTVKLKKCPYVKTGINVNACTQRDVREMDVSSDFGKALAPRDIGCHLSVASKSTDTGAPYVVSSSTSMTTQVFDIRRRHVSRAPVVTSLHGETLQGCYRHSTSFIAIAPNVHSVLYDPLSHSVTTIPSQNHGESFTERRLRNHTAFAADTILASAHFTFEPAFCETGFASSHLLDTDDLSNPIYTPYSSFNKVGKTSASLGNEIVLEAFAIQYCTPNTLRSCP